MHYTVIVVEDNPTSDANLRALIEEYGEPEVFVRTEAEDADEALRSISAVRNEG